MDSFIDRMVNHNVAQAIMFPFMGAGFIAGFIVAFIPTLAVMTYEEIQLWSWKRKSKNQ